jgi:hypothetical protein
MALTTRTLVELGNVEARRALCGVYADTRNGLTVMVAGAALPFAQTRVRNPDHPDGWQPYGEYAWPTVLRLVEDGKWVSRP